MDKMTDSRAVEVLAAHNEWRRGGDGPQTDPTTLGLAIDHAIARLREPAGAPALIVDHAGNTHSWPLMNLPSGTRLFTTPQPPAEAQAQGGGEAVVLAPHFRGYAHLGTGDYMLLHSREDHPAELCIVPATEQERAGTTVGDLRDDAPDEVPAERIAVRLRFENVEGLNALEQQLRLLRDVHFPDTAPPSAPVGWKLVPVEPTPEMRQAYHDVMEAHESATFTTSPDDQWNAMLAAAPALAQQPAAVDGADAQDAEIEALRAEVRYRDASLGWWGRFASDAVNARKEAEARAERLAEALRGCRPFVAYAYDQGIVGAEEAGRSLDALLRDQEEGK